MQAQLSLTTIHILTTIMFGSFVIQILSMILPDKKNYRSNLAVIILKNITFLVMSAWLCVAFVITFMWITMENFRFSIDTSEYTVNFIAAFAGAPFLWGGLRASLYADDKLN